MTHIENLNELFKQRGAQARCSKGTGIAESLLSNYKNGKAEPSFTNAIAIADFFDVSLDWLAGRDGFERDSHKRARSPALAPEERRLLDQYRGMDGYSRETIDRMAGQLVVASEKDGTGERPDVVRAGIDHGAVNS